MSNILLKCTSCRLPETYETIEFDDSGVCNICHGSQFKEQEIDWTARRAQLDELVEKHRGKHDYDCIVPFSGGKDSTFQLYFLVKEYGLKPSCKSSITVLCARQSKRIVNERLENWALTL